MHNLNGWHRHIYDIYAAKASQPINSNTKVREQYVYLGSQLNGTICEHNVECDSVHARTWHSDIHLIAIVCI